MMLALSGVRVVETLGSNEEISLYRVVRIADGQSFIVKTISESYAGSDKTASFEYEYERLRELNGKGTLLPDRLEVSGDRPYLFLQDPGGTTLDQVMRTRRSSLKLQELLETAIAMAGCLQQLHQEHVTVHEIVPFYLLVNESLTDVKVLDVRSCRAEGQPLPSHSASRLDSHLPYLSPEQTRRTGRMTDYRTDFYALGTILYEWFAGSVPFSAQHAMDLIHKHLASTPEPVSHRNKSIPSMVSDIVLKCMEKMPDERYASAYGMKSDLEECLVQLRVTGTIRPFPLATHDISERWIVSEGLIGRRAEQQVLLQALQRASEGAHEMIWISGKAGIGKTALVRETLRGAVPAEGVFIVAQSASSTTARPYEIWLQVIEQLVARLLTVNPLQAEIWKLRILDAVQDFGQLLIDSVPRMALLIGEQPEVEVLPPEEARIRFQLVMDAFFRLFLGQERPFVLFMDDLQWADEASIHYLSHWLADEAAKHLLVVGAYRDQELLLRHPLQEMMGQLPDTGMPIQHIHLAAFDQATLRMLLKPVMQGEIEGDSELISVLLRKTEGNPLYLQQFLQDLWVHKLVTFNERSRIWEWDVRRIQERDVPHQAAEFMSDSLKQLPAHTVGVLSQAACLGKQFDLYTLSAVTGLSTDQLLAAVESAVSRRMLQPIHGIPMNYAFQHERIRQSAYASVSEREKTRLHMEIGLLMVQRMNAGEDISICDILSHWNQASQALVLRGRGQELAEMNLQAGLEAKQSEDIEAALDYFRQATKLLEEEGWDSCYSLTYQAYKERAEAEFLSAHFSEAQQLFHHILSHAATDYDKAKACLMLIRMETNRDRFHEVLALSEKALGYLGLRYRSNAGSSQLLRQWMRIRWKLRNTSVEMLEFYPPMTDERHQAAMSILDYASHASFVLDKNGWFSSILMMLELTIDDGMTEEASVAFAGYAMVLSFKFHQHEAAYKWGTLACKVSKSNARLHALAVSSFSVCYNSWRRYEPHFLPVSADTASKKALQSGDLWNANQSMLLNCALLFQFSHPLRDIYRRLLEYAPHFQRNDNLLHGKQAAILARMIQELTGYQAEHDPYIGIDIQERSFVEDVSGTNDYFLQEFVYIYQYITGYLFGHYEQAYVALEGCMQLAELRSEPSADSSSHDYYRVLVLRERYSARTKREQAGDWREIRRCLRRLKTMARHSPQNGLHKYLLAKAEAASLRGRDRQAESLYEQALETAVANGLIHDAGTAAECFAKHCIARGKVRLAKLYIHEAYESYRRWGALAKAASMEVMYRHLLHLKRETDTDLERIDYLSVVMSAQALSGEMEMDKLLRMLMRIMMQNAGADYGALMFEDEEGWKIEACGSSEELHIASTPLEQGQDLVPVAIIDYTARTREEVVLNDAAASGLFQRNDYIKNKELKSVLCLPITNQNKLICLLYLENNLSSGVFTEERLDVLKLLSSQCAISLANAKLYSGIQYLKSNLEDQVAERTSALEKSMRATSEALAETTVYAERTRIAQEIHDIVGHTLTSTILQIEAGRRLLQKDMDSAVVRLKEAQDLVRHSLSEIRNSVHMLKEDKYYDIEVSLRQLIYDTERNTGVVVHASIDSVPHLSFMHKKVVYHALQEGLTNGIRHGDSNEFYFRLEDNGSRVLFSLADNGKGTSRIEMGFGLTMMRERVQQLKGTLQMDSEPNKGSLLRIQLPYEN
ncbi:AAA family ATPase [Paenibacillus chungangensis]|uniref:AAA family ATPase n=1 Tax=Paenibacillus chungangensis TaxID=696535 RepID=A0ABW3HR87_9BACL